MPEIPTNTFSRPARLEDFFDDDDANNCDQNKYNKNNSYNDKNNIPKNQQEFGNRKRIKP